MYASHLENILEQKPLLASFIRQAHVQVYPFGVTGYSQTESQTQSIELESWADVTFRFPQGLVAGPLRLDPASFSCLIEVDSLSVQGDAESQVIWRADNPEELRKLTFAGTSRRLENTGRCMGLSTGEDPQLLFPELPDTGKPTLVTIRIRVSRAFESAAEVLSG